MNQTIPEPHPVSTREKQTMKAKSEVLDVLSMMLEEELLALNQYMLHAEMQENWGYLRLSKEIRKLSIVEMKHAEALIERILFLEGTPNLSDFPKLNVGKDVKQQLQNDLALEKSAVGAYNKAIAALRRAGDQGSAELLKKLLLDEEEHEDMLDTQLGIIKDIGLEKYLVEQTKG
jgi:bacterioferritin